MDLAREAVEGAQDAFARHGVDGEFVVGDVRQLPFPDDSFDFVYAGGVVEHFRESGRSVAEMTRVLRPGGRVLFTVPALTLSYPYLFLRGNVPAVPLVEQVFSFVQFRLLRGKLATFGYERSFLAGDVRKLLVAVELDVVVVDRFDTYLPVLTIPGRLRPLARRLARTKLLAPMYYGTGIKRSLCTAGGRHRLASCAVADLRLIPRSEFDRVRAADGDRDAALSALADMCRLNALVAVKRAGSGHLGSSFSALDIVSHLLFEELNVAEVGFEDPDRDVFFSSKGHDVPGLYAALFALGVIPRERFLRLRRHGGLDGHPTSASPASRRTRARWAWASRRGAGSPGRSGGSAGEGASS